MRRLFLLVLALVLSACGGGSYLVEPFEPASLDGRALERNEHNVRVRTAVPGVDESRAIFGVPLYEQGIQPVWLEIKNDTEKRLRYAPVGTDLEYFSALEVAYKNRSGYSREALQALESHMLELAMPRHVEAGETVSGFVFTHREPGTKGYNVDLFGDEVSIRFTFFVDVPGFVPDYKQVAFDQLYAPENVHHTSSAELYDVLGQLPRLTSDSGGDQSGSPANVVLIGDGRELLYALLRARWSEASAPVTRGSAEDDYYFFSRRQDAVFRYDRGSDIDGYYELRLWLSPIVADSDPVWVGQLRHVIEHRWIDATADPDVDAALVFLLQNLWYSETLLKYGWIDSGVGEAHQSMTDFQGAEYFATGIRSVLWLSGDPVELAEVDAVEWDQPEVR